MVDVIRQLLSGPWSPCGLMMLTEEFAGNCEIPSYAKIYIQLSGTQIISSPREAGVPDGNGCRV